MMSCVIVGLICFSVGLFVVGPALKYWIAKTRVGRDEIRVAPSGDPLARDSDGMQSVSEIAIMCPDEDCCGCLTEKIVGLPECNECGRKVRLVFDEGKEFSTVEELIEDILDAPDPSGREE